jgi:predicted ArsR family transcriptional regulator
MTEHHSTAEFIEAIEAGARTSAEVAERVGVTPEGARQRLLQLRDEGRVAGEKLGGNWIWSVAKEE